MWRRLVQPAFDVADGGSYDLLDYIQFAMWVGPVYSAANGDFCCFLFNNDVDQNDYSGWLPIQTEESPGRNACHRAIFHSQFVIYDSP